MMQRKKSHPTISRTVNENLSRRDGLTCNGPPVGWKASAPELCIGLSKREVFSAVISRRMMNLPCRCRADRGAGRPCCRWRCRRPRRGRRAAARCSRTWPARTWCPCRRSGSPRRPGTPRWEAASAEPPESLPPWIKILDIVRSKDWKLTPPDRFPRFQVLATPIYSICS